MFEILLENSFDFLSDEYQRLFERSRATAFQHPLWLDRLYRTLAPALKAEPAVIAVRRRRSGELAMLLPLMRRRRGALRVIEFADLEVTDYASPVCDDATLAQLAGNRDTCNAIRTRLKPYDLLRIKKLPDDALPLDRLLGVGGRVSMGMSAHAVRLYEPFSQWRGDNIVYPFVSELEKKRRKLNRKGVVRFECSIEPQVIKTTLDSMRAYRMKRFPDDRFQHDLYFDFYQDIAQAGAQNGFSRTYTLSLDGRPIGGLFGLVHQGHFLVLLSAFDLTNHKRHSVGGLLFENVAQDCIAREDLVLDFTIGDEAYKQRFGAQPSEMWMISAGATPPGMLAAFVVDKAPWAKKVAEEILHRPTASPASVRQA